MSYFIFILLGSKWNKEKTGKYLPRTTAIERQLATTVEGTIARRILSCSKR